MDFTQSKVGTGRGKRRGGIGEKQRDEGNELEREKWRKIAHQINQGRYRSPLGEELSATDKRQEKWPTQEKPGRRYCPDGGEKIWAIVTQSYTHRRAHAHTYMEHLAGGNVPGETRDAGLAAVRVRKV